MCYTVGQASAFDYQTDWPLLTASSPQTALFLLRELLAAGFLVKQGDGPIPPYPTWKAYERLEHLQASGRSSDRGFVAMSFSRTRDAVWENVIKPAIEDAGYSPIRVDKIHFNERIDDEILSQIRRCRFLVADFTEQKAGVYFEVGFALD